MNTILVPSLDSVPVETIRAAVADHGYAIVRGLVTPEDALASADRARAAFTVADDHPSVGESGADVRRCFQKLSVGTGGGGHRATSYARLLRVIFTPFLDVDRYGVHDVLRPVAVLRNRLLGLRDDFAVDGIEEALWTAARLQQYPRGGGFLQRHVDQAAVDALPDGSGSYVQLVLVLSRRGVDFERGGAFVEHGGDAVDLEDLVELGDVVVYDERSVHGVAEIDTHALLDLSSLGGRLAGFVNLYKVMG